MTNIPKIGNFQGSGITIPLWSKHTVYSGNTPMIMKRLFFAILLLAGTLTLKAQTEDPVTWSYAVKEVTQTEAVITIKATIADQWHIYSMELPANNPMATSITYTPSRQYQLVGKITESNLMSTDQTTDLHLSYFEHYAVFEQRIKLKAKQVAVTQTITFLAENNKVTLAPRTIELTIPVTN